MSSTALKNWWSAYPDVKSTPQPLTADEVASLIRKPELKGKVAVIDVRRNDHDVRIAKLFSLCYMVVRADMGFVHTHVSGRTCEGQ